MKRPHWALAENNYGREAAAFLLDNWKQLRPRSGRLLEQHLKVTIFDKQLGRTTTAAMKRPHWAFAENNYGREAAAFLLDKRKHTTTAAKRPPF